MTLLFKKQRDMCTLLPLIVFLMTWTLYAFSTEPEAEESTPLLQQNPHTWPEQMLQRVASSLSAPCSLSETSTASKAIEEKSAPAVQHHVDVPRVLHTFWDKAAQGSSFIAVIGVPCVNESTGERFFIIKKIEYDAVYKKADFRLGVLLGTTLGIVITLFFK